MRLEFFKKEKASAKKTFKPKKSGEEQVVHDWWVMLTVLVLLVVVIAGLDIYLFVKVNQGDYFVATGEVQDNETVLTKKALLDAQNFFDARQKEYDAFVASPPAEIDPSI